MPGDTETIRHSRAEVRRLTDDELYRTIADSAEKLAL